jgi:hypothetical protein
MAHGGLPAVGPIPATPFILHRCNNAPCVNPEHLYEGTQKDNMADREAAGRHGLKLHPESRLFGARNPRAVLGTADVSAIRECLRSGMAQKKIAELYGIGQAQVCRINTGKRWGHITKQTENDHGNQNH